MDLHRDNLLVLVERIITTDIKCLQFLKEEVIKHIIHANSRAMSKKCHMVCQLIVTSSINIYKMQLYNKLLCN